MIASLPMYATPLTAGGDTRFWEFIRDGLRARGIAAPDRLTHSPPDLIAHWRDPALVLSQTCGLPYRAALKDQVTLVGTPDYGIEGCPPGHYQSVVIARADDDRQTLSAFQGARFAYNDPLSQSGWAALALERPEALHGPKLQTGSHQASALAVRKGVADFVAIDVVTWRHLMAQSVTAGLHIIHATQPTPGLPFITAKTQDPAPIFAAMNDAITALSSADQATLGLKAVIDLPPGAYDLPLPPNPVAFAP
ncbi:MAG: PhnD/SsuA/transferrin family substrate-binding protein [Pseudomonadota bacterium]